MRFRITTCLVLAAIMLQSVFGGLQGSVVICLGGGHEHEQVAATEQCEWGCSHHDELVTPTSDEEHIANCDCTDIELGLITLLRTPRGVDHDLQVVLAAPLEVASVQHDHAEASSPSMRGPPGILQDDPGTSHRLTVVRSTRLII
ncbi:MAG: hypothetical protein VX908_06455 [Planctomycetota bacterium]|nr:hypothetical protein [Planctomycetota bacterium]